MKQKTDLSRREFITLSSASTLAVLTGCATNPVTGESELMLVSENGEIAADRESSPHQFSADYGPVADTELNQYLSAVGNSLAVGLGGLGAGMLLAHYSRDNERQADEVGLRYLVRAGYNPRGMIGLMEVLRRLSREKPSALEMLFATHPLSDERYQNAVNRVQSEYAAELGRPVNRERYLDKTVRLRALKPALEKMQAGEEALMKKKYAAAQTALSEALQMAPHDYAGLLLMAKCQLAQNRPQEALRYTQAAEQAAPHEPQAVHVHGMIAIKERRYDEAYQQFMRYTRLLPGNPTTDYYQGFSLEGLSRRPEAAQAYRQYLNQVSEGELAQHAQRRLIEWGYLTPAPAVPATQTTKPTQTTRPRRYR